MAKSLINIPSFLRTSLEGNRAITLRGVDIGSTNSWISSSFMYDPSEVSLKNTQQLNLDWSKFEQHTFFSPATVNVNSAFDKIINEYPFDGTRVEVERFFEGLTGFENWVYSEFPKYRGQLLFTSSLETYIEVFDRPGALFPELLKKPTSDVDGGVIGPKLGEPLSIELHMYSPGVANLDQVVVQKMYQGDLGPVGIYLFLSGSDSTTTTSLSFLVSSGSAFLTASTTIDKGVFNHVYAEFNNSVEYDQQLTLTIGSGSLLHVATSSKSTRIGTLDFPDVPLLIGSGSSYTVGDTTYAPLETLNAALDELRIFKKVRTAAEIESYRSKSVFAQEDLALYYKFNEPPPILVGSLTDSLNAIVLDSSGNSMHATVSNFTGSLRVNASGSAYGDPMALEKSNFSPILFPAQTDVVSLNTRLLASASLYDSENPNLITKLVPAHYFLEGQVEEGTSTIDGTIVDSYTGTSIPGTGQLGSTQLLMSLLYVMAKYFDELKQYVDSFSTIQYVDYEKSGSVPDNFLQKLLVQKGFVIPPIFSHSTIEQYVDAENLQYPTSTGTESLRYVQNELLRRLLINLPSIVRSKGTQFSLKAFLRSLGIDPDNSCRIREYGGPTKSILGSARETKREVAGIVNFNTSSILVRSHYLSSSRREIGWPLMTATSMVSASTYPPHGISQNSGDGLWTSGSWTYETIVRFPLNRTGSASGYDSIVRMNVSGSGTDNWGLIGNLVAVSGTATVDPSVHLYMSVELEQDTDFPRPAMDLELKDVDLYTGDLWNVSFGRVRCDQIGSEISASYFLRAGRSSGGEIVEFKTTSSFFLECVYVSGGFAVPNSHILENAVADYNEFGTFLTIGENQTYLVDTGSNFKYLNNTDYSDVKARETRFSGQQMCMRFWSKALTEIEWREHVRNYKSVGTINPLTNYDYIYTPTGSFERLRLNTFLKQDERTSDGSGNIYFLDFSENGYHMTGSGFPASTQVIIPTMVDYSFISPMIDEASTDQKVRVRSFLDYENVTETQGSQLAPLYELDPSEKSQDDVRLSIDFSLIDALNRDIVTIFSTLESLDDAIGDPSLMFSSDYPDLDRMRTMYFNNLTDKLNFKAFHEFFKFFDMSLGTFIEQLIPKKTKFKGLNFMIESHMLERHKLEYFFNEMYLGPENRYDLNKTLLLAQVVGTVKKY